VTEQSEAEEEDDDEPAELDDDTAEQTDQPADQEPWDEAASAQQDDETAEPLPDDDDATEQAEADEEHEDAEAAAPEDATAEETDQPADEEPWDEAASAPRDDDETAQAEPFLDEMSEEEKTINRLIDQELLSIAVEDEDGQASTIVPLPDEAIDSAIATNDQAARDDASHGEPAAALFESIIMEGPTVRNQDDPERLKQSREIRNNLRAQEEEEQRRKLQAKRRRRNTIAAAITLTLLLAAQAVHWSREALATLPVVHKTLAPVYRLLGKPLTPAWDIRGWRFEATKGSTDDLGQVLTIYSQVGNNSDQALPYPLVHVSLTDRFEEIIGSRVLEPAEYLAAGDDPRKPVPPGESFAAIMDIDTPTAEATGFKLNVCYRMADGNLRCAVDNFK
jgi:hypothetical protein